MFHLTGGISEKALSQPSLNIRYKLYRVTHLVVQNLPLTSKQKFHFGLAWPGHARPGQNRTYVLKSTGGFAQRDVSPCTVSETQLYVTAELLDDDNENLAAILARGDSNESNESLGDVPIELRHLEDDNIPSHLDDEESDVEDEDEAGENTWTAYYKVN